MDGMISSKTVGYIYYPVYRDNNGQYRCVLFNNKLHTFWTRDECIGFINSVLKPNINKTLDLKSYTRRRSFWSFGFLRKPIIDYSRMPTRDTMIDLTAMVNTLTVAKK